MQNYNSFGFKGNPALPQNEKPMGMMMYPMPTLGMPLGNTSNTPVFPMPSGIGYQPGNYPGMMVPPPMMSQIGTHPGMMPPPPFMMPLPPMGSHPGLLPPGWMAPPNFPGMGLQGPIGFEGAKNSSGSNKSLENSIYVCGKCPNCKLSNLQGPSSKVSNGQITVIGENKVPTKSDQEILNEFSQKWGEDAAPPNIYEKIAEEEETMLQGDEENLGYEE